MISIKVGFNVSEEGKLKILNRQKQFSYFFRKLYKHYDKINDKEYITKLTKIYGLSVYESNCLIIDVKTKFKQIQTNKDKLSQEILDLQDDIKELQSKIKLTKKETRNLFKYQKNLSYKNRNLSKDITFGTRKLLKEISYLNNDKKENKNTIITKTDEYHSNRILPLSLYGSKCDPNSNRFFEFDFTNNQIIYKMNSENKIYINYVVKGNYKKQLKDLQLIKDLNILPISVKLDHEYLCITVDNEMINGEPFDYKTYIKEIKEKNNGKYDKNIYIKHKQEQTSRKLVGKNQNRFAAVDLNPDYIGLVILDKTSNDEVKVIDSKCYDLSELMKKSGKDVTVDESLYLTRKRKHEIGNIYVKIFDIITHYKCGYFVMEDLNFKSNSQDEMSKEVRRKINNCWNLGFQTNLINKHCDNNGLILIKVNPCYSSFIGNINYSVFDPVAAATEIGRRGAYKYDKNGFYPKFTSTMLNTVVERFINSFPDVSVVKDCENWVSLYKLFKKAGIIYRWQLTDIKPVDCSSKNTKRNHWKVYTF